MGLRYLHLDDTEVRAEMAGRWMQERYELEAMPNGRECYGRRLTDAGWEQLGEVMPTALSERDDDWLSEQLTSPAYWQARELQVRRGRPVFVNYNKRDAVRQLAYGEFNIAYIHGLAHVLLKRGETHAVVYRAGPAVERRAECTSWEGTEVPLQVVIEGHRARYWPRPGRPGAWSLPTGVSCHHSIHAVDRPPEAG